MRNHANDDGVRLRPVLLYLAGALLLAPLVLGACGGGPDDDRPVLVSVTAEPDGVTPGGRTTLLWRFRLADHWHLYWTGRNDSGFPPQVDLDLPEGWLAGALQWPAPERLVLPGGILDHVYEDELVLLQQISAPADAEPGSVLTATAAVRWLGCREMCVPGQASVDLELPVVLVAPAAGPALAEAKARLPQPLPAGVMETRWEGSVFHIQAAAPDDAVHLTFMPTTDCGELADPVADADADGPRLALRFLAREGTAGPVRGLLRITDAGGVARTHVLSQPAIVLPDARLRQ